MRIELKNIGKRYQKEWVFKDLNCTFPLASTTGIIGTNGSGKSTLIKIISAAELPTKGEISFLNDKNQSIHPNDIFAQINFTAPYIDLPEQLTAIELIQFHLSFKPLANDLNITDLLKLTFLEESKNKFIKNFSSGMTQRLKLGLSICTQSSILLLDEPCSNLDQKGISMYHDLMEKFNKNRLTIIGSNEQKDELFQIEQTLNIMDFKPTN